jgi:PncC family amidohydrolase
VEEMADGARNRARTQVAVSISGVAGPSGGSEEKPVGTVCVAVSSSDFMVKSWCMRLGTRRDLIRRRSAVAAALLVEAALREPDSLDRVEKWNYS